LDVLPVVEPDLVLLDLGLPDIDGIDVLRKIRSEQLPTPVIVLTARNQTSSKIDALDIGADDYLAKPFDLLELMARIRAVTRRHNLQTSSQLSHGEVSLDLAAHSLTVGDKVTMLNRREFALLRELMLAVGRVKTRDALENSMYTMETDVGSNTIEVYISHLRRHLPKDFIKTIRGVGYVVPK
jgi:DNA-binding response OmpR family regulator